MEDLKRNDSPLGEIKANEPSITANKSGLNMGLVLPLIFVVVVFASLGVYLLNVNSTNAQGKTTVSNSSVSSAVSPDTTVVVSLSETSTSSVSPVNKDTYTSKKLGITVKKLKGSNIFPSKVEELSQIAVPYTSSTTKLNVPVLRITNMTTWIEIIKYDPKYSYEEYFKWSEMAEASVVGEVYPCSDMAGSTTIKKGLSMSFVGGGTNGYRAETATPKHVVYYNEIKTDPKSSGNKTYLMKIGNNKYIVRVYVNDANDVTIATDASDAQFESTKKANMERYMKTNEERLKEAEVVVNSIKAI